jgi:hypothetical protein
LFRFSPILSILIPRAGDETHPACKACGKKNRLCQWEEPHTKFKDYQPDGHASSKSAAGGTDDSVDSVDARDKAVRADSVSEETFSRNTSPRRRKNGRTDRASKHQSTRVSSPLAESSPGSPYFVSQSKRTTGSVSVASLLQSHSLGNTPEGSPSVHTSQALQQTSSPLHNRREILEGVRNYPLLPISLTHEEALLVHHYTEHLSRWLDCTDATHQFALLVPEKIKQCPLLCYAVMSFAARHCRKDAAADAAYQRCIALLVEQLNEDAASHDETLLCAIVILRFYEQLTGAYQRVYCESQS